MPTHSRVSDQASVTDSQPPPQATATPRATVRAPTPPHPHTSYICIIITIWPRTRTRTWCLRAHACDCINISQRSDAIAALLLHSALLHMHTVVGRSIRCCFLRSLQDSRVRTLRPCTPIRQLMCVCTCILEQPSNVTLLRFAPRQSLACCVLRVGSRPHSTATAELATPATMIRAATTALRVWKPHCVLPTRLPRMPRAHRLLSAFSACVDTLGRLLCAPLRQLMLCDLLLRLSLEPRASSLEPRAHSAV